jgi:hypothetical protein
MNTPIDPPPNPTKTYSQTDAAALVGVSQRALVDRDKKRGWLTKLNYCFPGYLWELVAVGSLEEQRKVRLTEVGVKELRDIIQACSPEPPTLDAELSPVRENGAVVKIRLPCPRYTLADYAQTLWFLQQIDGAGEHERLKLQAIRNAAPEQVECAAVEAELMDSGEIVSVQGSAEGLLDSAFEFLSESDRNFWDELNRRKQQGKLMGRLLGAATLSGMAEGEQEVQNQYYEKSVHVAQSKRESCHGEYPRGKVR